MCITHRTRVNASWALHCSESARKAAGIENMPIMMRVKNHSAVIEACTAEDFKIEKHLRNVKSIQHWLGLTEMQSKKQTKHNCIVIYYQCCLYWCRCYLDRSKNNISSKILKLNAYVQKKQTHRKGGARTIHANVKMSYYVGCWLCWHGICRTLYTVEVCILKI